MLLKSAVTCGPVSLENCRLVLELDPLELVRQREGMTVGRAGVSRPGGEEGHDPDLHGLRVHGVALCVEALFLGEAELSVKL